MQGVPRGRAGRPPLRTARSLGACNRPGLLLPRAFARLEPSLSGGLCSLVPFAPPGSPHARTFIRSGLSLAWALARSGPCPARGFCPCGAPIRSECPFNWKLRLPGALGRSGLLAARGRRSLSAFARSGPSFAPVWKRCHMMFRLDLWPAAHSPGPSRTMSHDV
jgi:hypothetical protein